MKTPLAALFVVAGIAAGFAAGRATAPAPEAPAGPSGAEVASANARAEKAESELAALRDAKRRPRDADAGPAGEIAPETRAPHDEGNLPSTEAQPANEKTRLAQANAKLRQARLDLQPALDAHDGEKLLTLLKQFAEIARDLPEARDDAMRLAADLNKDVNGAGEFHLSQFVFYGGLGDPAVKDLMLWSLENQGSSTADFRVLSAWSIPWALKSDEAIARYDAALQTEKDRSVQNAIVSNLSSMNTPMAETVLAKVLADATRDPALRGEAALALASSTDPAVQRAIETAAQSDPDPKVQSSAKVSLIVRNPPATGVLVMQTATDGNAESAGVRPGDIIVSYNGRAVGTNDELVHERDAAQNGTAESVPMLVVRDGREMTISVKTGRLGLQNVRPVRKK